MSRDPENPDMGRPNDPKTLHKYLYAGGDPMNYLDPSGRGPMLDDALLTGEIVLRYGTRLVLASLTRGAAQFAAYIALYAGYAYLTIPQFVGIVSEILVTNAIARALACATVALMIDRVVGKDNEYAGGIASVIYATVCETAVPHHL